MTHTDVVKKLIGNINPIGQSSVDEERFNNLKDMCDLVNNLVGLIDDVAWLNRDSHEHSVMKARDYAKSFLTDTLGISNE
jgi:hypothetical protein